MSCRSAPCVGTRRFTHPVVAGPLGALLAKRRALISRIIRSACAAPSAAASLTPTRLRNGAWPPRRSTPTSWQRAARGERSSRPTDSFEGIMSTALAEDELLSEVRLPLLAEDARFGFYEFSRRAGDFAIAMALATVSPEGRHHRRAACRRRRRRGPTAPHGGSRSRSRRKKPGDESSAPRPKPPRRRSIRWRISRPMPTYRRDLVRAVVRRALEQRGGMTAPTKGSGLTWVGRSIRRLEDPALVTGHGRFTADLPAPIRCASCAARSPPAASTVSRLPDGATVFTAADLAAVKPIMPVLHKFNYMPVASRFWPQTSCALSASRSPPLWPQPSAEAEDIADHVTLTISEMPADHRRARRSARRRAARSYAGRAQCRRRRKASRRPALPRAQTTAHRRITIEMRSRRQNATPMEARAGHAAYDPIRSA